MCTIPGRSATRFITGNEVNHGGERRGGRPRTEGAQRLLDRGGDRRRRAASRSSSWARWPACTADSIRELIAHMHGARASPTPASRSRTRARCRSSWPRASRRRSSAPGPTARRRVPAADVAPPRAGQLPRSPAPHAALPARDPAQALDQRRPAPARRRDPRPRGCRGARAEKDAARAWCATPCARSISTAPSAWCASTRARWAWATWPGWPSTTCT